MQSIQELIKNFELYINADLISSDGNGNLVVSYSYLIYDLIDKDLDFNEEYYKQMMSHFHHIMEIECVRLVKDNTFGSISIDISRAIPQIDGDKYLNIIEKSVFIDGFKSIIQTTKSI